METLMILLEQTVFGIRQVIVTEHLHYRDLSIGLAAHVERSFDEGL